MGHGYLKFVAVFTGLLTLTACDVAYHSPQVNPLLASQSKVREIAITPESVLSANSSTYTPPGFAGDFLPDGGRRCACGCGGAWT